MSKHKFSFLTAKKIQDLKEIKLKKRTHSKINWAVNAYNEWHDAKLNSCYEEVVFHVNLSDLDNLTKENLEGSMCFFISEVVKSKGDGLYPGKTLYEMCIAMQKYLQINKINWKLVEGDDFQDLGIVLDNVMKEHASLHVGTVTKQADLITFDYENKLWDRGILGEDCPDRLRNTVLFLSGIHLALRASDEHYNLRRDTPAGLESQLSFERNSMGQGALCIMKIL